MAAYSVVCPECRTSLKTPKPIAPGTPLECPKCQVMFAAPKLRPAARPAARPAGKPSAFTPPLHRDQIGDDVVEDVEVVDDVEVIDDVEVVDDDAPPRRKKAPPPARRKLANRGVEVEDDDEDDDFDDRPRRKFKAKRKSGSNKGLVVGLVVLGVLVVVGGLGGLAYWLLTGGAGGEEPLAYLPPDTQFVAGANLGAIARDVPALGQQLDGGFAAITGGANFKDEAGIEAKEMFEQMVVGGKMTSGPPEFTIVTLSSKPFDRNKINGRQQQGMTRKSAFGQTYFQPTDAGNPIKATIVPSKRNMVMTALPEPRFEPVFRADGKTIKLGAPLPALVAKVRSSHAWVVLNLDGAIKQQILAASSQAPGVPANSGAAMTEALADVNAVAMWATISAGMVDFHVGLECNDAAAAQAKVAKAQADAAKQTAALSAMTLFLPAPAKAAVEEVKKSLKFAANGTTAEISMSVSVANLEALFAQLAGAGQQRPQQPNNQPDPGQRRGPQRRGVNRGGGS